MMRHTVTAHGYLSNRLSDGMSEGMMHGCLRDTGRLAGGLLAAGDLREHEVAELGDLAESLAINKSEAANKWREAVAFGRSQPVKWDTHPAKQDCVLGWDSVIRDDYRVIDPEWVEAVEVCEPTDWNPVAQISEYLTALFSAEEYVGFVVESFEKDGKKLPTRGNYSQTAGELLANLSRYNDIGAVFGDVDPEVGAWIRFNPLDGQGVYDKNVTDFRYALVESDKLPIDQQHGIYKTLELPIAALVHSGNKSLHAIVRIEAESLEEYRRRVDLLYHVCEKNGLATDLQNRNPSRLSRMPGVMRNGKKQYLVATNTGKPDWNAWEAWVKVNGQAVNESAEIPSPVSLRELVAKYPDQRPLVIDGLLRRGETMNLISDPKRGKSWLVYLLAICVAFGLHWFGRFRCTPGRVLLLDGELHPETIAGRLPAVAEAMGVGPAYLDLIDVEPLRGLGVDLLKLRPFLESIERDRYTLIILDAWYRFLPVGFSENDNAQVMALYNMIDSYASTLNAGWVNVHHASKGSQGDKAITDVGSGAGSQSRAADCHLILRRHEDADLATLEAAVRSFPPVEPLAIRWSFPIWLADEAADPRKLWTPRVARQQTSEDHLDEDRQSIVNAAVKLAGPETKGGLRDRFGPGYRRFNIAFASLVADGTLVSGAVEKANGHTYEGWKVRDEENT